MIVQYCSKHQLTNIAELDVCTLYRYKFTVFTLLAFCFRPNTTTTVQITLPRNTKAIHPTVAHQKVVLSQASVAPLVQGATVVTTTAKTGGCPGRPFCLVLVGGVSVVHQCS